MITIKVIKYLEGAREGKRGRSKGDVKREAAAKGGMEKNRNLRVIERKKVRRIDPIQYFLFTGLRRTFESQR